MKAKKKQRRSVRVFECAGKAGGFFKTFVVPRARRYKGVDGVRLEMRNSEGAFYRHDLKDWEAQAVATGLNFALLQKKLNQKRG